MKHLGILITCYNRANTTINSLTLLSSALEEQKIEHTFYVVDDNSRDGTAEAIERSIRHLSLIRGSGFLFWNGGMREAFKASLKDSQITDYLVFNDDVSVDRNAFSKIWDEYIELNKNKTSILVASTIGSKGQVSYSAYIRKSKHRPLLLERVEPNGIPVECDTFNGNFVLLPASFMRTINAFDAHFKHAYGDLDLGYMARKSGIQVFLASIPIGKCLENIASSPKKGGRYTRIIMGSWGKQDTLKQRIYFQYKHGVFLSTLIFSPIIAVRYALHRIFD